MGSPVLVVNVTDPEDVLMAAHYDAWGVATLDETTSADASWPIPHGFAGGLHDEDTGFVRFGARDDDPRVGRWTGRDLILFDGGLANLYSYAGSDPLNWIDPRGKVPWGLIGDLLTTAGVIGLAVVAVATAPVWVLPASLAAIGVGVGLSLYDQTSGISDLLDFFEKTKEETEERRRKDRDRWKEYDEVVNPERDSEEACE